MSDGWGEVPTVIPTEFVLPRQYPPASQLYRAGAKLRGAVLSGRNLDRVDFTRADLRGANLERSQLIDAQMQTLISAERPWPMLI